MSIEKKIEKALSPRPVDKIFPGRVTALSDKMCHPMIGCGKKIQSFDGWSEIEQAEYCISGLCRACQERFFS